MVTNKQKKKLKDAAKGKNASKEKKETKKVTTKDQIKALEEEIKNTKYNKRTQRSIGLTKAKLARLKAKEEARSSKGKTGEGFSVRKSGDATVVLLGFPSVGKSSLLNKITNANSPVGHYAFTTLNVIPGVMHYNHAKIQVLDVPGIVRGAAAGTGRGKEVLQVLRSADLILILLDAFYPEHFEILKKEVFDTGVRLNKTKPDVKIKKTGMGGIRVGKTVRLEMSDDTIKSILNEFRLNNCDILIRDVIDEDDLIDVIEGHKKYVPQLVVVNKVDIATEEQVESIKKEINPDLFISAEGEINLDILKDKIYEGLGLMPLFLKEVGKKPDLEEPMIIKKGSTIKDVCTKLHRDFLNRYKYSRLWGTSVKFDAQMIRKLDHVLQPNDILEIHLQ